MEETSALEKHLKEFVGQKIAIICARYHYWGIVSDVLSGDYPAIKLANPVSVTRSDSSVAQVPEEKHPLASSITVLISAIEMIHQPVWSQGPLPGEDGWE